MNNIGGFFGEVGLFCIMILALRLVFKIILRLPGMSIKKFPAWIKKLFQFTNKNHRIAGIVAVTAIIAHFVLQYQQFGYIPAGGLIAGAALLLQAGSGLALKAQKDSEKRKRFEAAHTVWGAVLVLAVLNHRLKLF
jgi:hypothetical protein